MQKFDLLIVGAGMVGLTLALALRKSTQLTIAIADTLPPTELSNDPAVRVSAINLASKTLFEHIDVWQDIEKSRVKPYQHMHIWDKAGLGKLDFSIDDLASFPKNEQLGWIIENMVIRQALWDKAQQDSGISFFTESKLANITMGESEVFASFEQPDPQANKTQQLPLIAKLVVGADGANSWVRKQIATPMINRDYDHHAIVATVKCLQGHKNTAWQVFLPTGPLAFLPLYPNDNNVCSIVYSTSPEEAQRLVALEPVEFAKELTAATDGKLGTIELMSERFTYPLSMRLAQDFVKERTVLIGDAAHTIHPLAGQGVNLGLLDAAALAQSLTELSADQDLANSKTLKAFARARKADAVEMIAAMEAIKQTFAVQHSGFKLLRGVGMSLLNNSKPAKQLMIEQALGLKSNLPELVKSTL